MSKAIYRVLAAFWGVARALPRVLFRRRRKGRRVILDTPGHALTWLGCTRADWDALLDAQNAIAAGVPGSDMGPANLMHAGRAFWVIGDATGEVVREELGSCLVAFDDGRQGWVQSEFTRSVA